MDREIVKCRIIDAVLNGEQLVIIRRYNGWSISTANTWLMTGGDLFGWKADWGDGNRFSNYPTLKQALALVDKYWERESINEGPD